MDRPQGVPDNYDDCPICHGEWRRCDHTWGQADKTWIRTQQNKARAGKKNGAISKTVVVDGTNLYLWKDGSVTWGN